ncbi:hypothetical protein GW17_00043645 [Ensete ventricosum]|nr:hypothetical protein GW17_00043645 [Ensete ventricosum]RZS00864.1 hypothetical protein BHM03_00030647 [Ensete ventricosum]
MQHHCHISSNKQRHLPYPICNRRRLLHQLDSLLSSSDPDIFSLSNDIKSHVLLLQCSISGEDEVLHLLSRRAKYCSGAASSAESTCKGHRPSSLDALLRGHNKLFLAVTR